MTMFAERIAQRYNSEITGCRFQVGVKKNRDRIIESFTDPVCRRICYSVGRQREQAAHIDCLRFIQHFLRRLLRDEQVEEDVDVSRWCIPVNTLIVSFSTKAFVPAVGRHPYVFADGTEMPRRSSCFTYQMVSKHVHVTYYNENGVRYLAGVTYYPQLADSFWINTRIDEDAITLACHTGGTYPPPSLSSPQRIDSSRDAPVCELKSEHEPEHQEQSELKIEQVQKSIEKAGSSKEVMSQPAPEPEKEVVVPEPADVVVEREAEVVVEEDVENDVEDDYSDFEFANQHNDGEDHVADDFVVL